MLAVFISDTAKLENTPGEMTVYTDLESTANLTVKFHMNPDNNCTVYWFTGDTALKQTNIRNTTKVEQIQDTYFILNVTSKKIGNYSVQVINWSMSEHNTVTFHMVLKLRGK